MKLLADSEHAELRHFAIDFQSDVIAVLRWKTSPKQTSLDQLRHRLNAKRARREYTWFPGSQITQHFAYPIIGFP